MNVKNFLLWGVILPLKMCEPRTLHGGTTSCMLVVDAHAIAYGSQTREMGFDCTPSYHTYITEIIHHISWSWRAKKAA